MDNEPTKNANTARATYPSMQKYAPTAERSRKNLWGVLLR